MATLSGVCYGGNWGDRYNIYLDYTLLSQDIPNNRSRIKLKLYAQASASNYVARRDVPQPWRIQINGSNVASGTVSMDFRNRAIVNMGEWTGYRSHNSNGTLSLTIGGSFEISGVTSLEGGTISDSWSLPTIPRASTLDSFSLPNSLRISTENTFSLGITRASTSFTHDIQLRDGTTVLQEWNGESLPTSLTIDSSTVDTLLSRMRTVTSKTLTLRVQTKSGSTNIGSAVTRTATVNVSSTVTPTISSRTASIYGSGRDSSIGMYIQGISKVEAKFSSNATGGAGVRSRHIEIGNIASGGSVVDNVFRLISPTLNGTGDITITYTITDTRGRSTSATRTISINAYTNPRITEFSAQRRTSSPTVVDVSRIGNWTALSGNNNANVLIQRRRIGTTTWTEVESITATTGSLNDTVTSTGNLINASYEFRLTVTDQFGNSATSSINIPTDKIVFGINQDKGVGIGKIHERGDLDVGGDMFVQDDIQVDGGLIFGANVKNVGEDGTITRIEGFTGGAIYSERAFKMGDNTYGSTAFPSTQGSWLYFQGADPLGDMIFWTGRVESAEQGLYFAKNDGNDTLGDFQKISMIVDEGVNSNGRYIKYNDGTMICYATDKSITIGTMTQLQTSGLWRTDTSSHIDIYFPATFIEAPTVHVSTNIAEEINLSTRFMYSTHLSGRFVSSINASNFSTQYFMLAIGRWK